MAEQLCSSVLLGGPANPLELLQGLETPSFLIHESHHRSCGATHRHAHELATISVLLGGGYRERYGRERDELQCVGQGVLLRPAAMEHLDQFGPEGAHLLVIELQNEQSAELQRQGLPLDALGLWDFPELSRLGLQIREELSHGAVASPIVEGLAFQLLADLCQLSKQERQRHGRPPSWLKRVLELLHDGFCEPTLRVRSLAEEASVHPVHLARVFKETHGCAPGDYLRRLRLDRAVELLTRGQQPLSDVALDAGFADQSHLTRSLRSRYGVTPGALRRAFQSLPELRG